MQQSSTYRLFFPVSHDGRNHGEVTLRRAKGRDMLAISKAARENRIEAGFLAISLLAQRS